MSDPIKRPSPLSIRLSPAERRSLEERAGGAGLSTFAKEILFASPAERTPGWPTTANRILLAHLLAMLGGSHVAPNLERLAREAQLGTLLADQETTDRLLDACDDVRLMHNALMRGLGMREKVASRKQLKAAEVFAKAAKPEDIQ